MKITMEVVKDHPVHNLRTYGLLAEGKRVAEFRKGSTGHWDIIVIKDHSKPLDFFNSTPDHAPNYHAAVRLATCHIVGDEARIPYLRRGIWTNPCPMPEETI